MSSDTENVVQVVTPRPYEGSRHPFQLFTLALCLFVGIPLLFGDARPDSISSLLPSWAENVWAVGLVAGAAITLYATIMRNRFHALLVEQVGLTTVGCAAIFYSAAVVINVGPPALLAAAFVAGFGLSCLWRWGQLQLLVISARAVCTEAGKTRRRS